MVLNWNEIKSRALLFRKTWADASNEDSQAKPFWLDLAGYGNLAMPLAESYSVAASPITGSLRRARVTPTFMRRILDRKPMSHWVVLRGKFSLDQTLKNPSLKPAISSS